MEHYQVTKKAFSEKGIAVKTVKILNPEEQYDVDKLNEFKKSIYKEITKRWGYNSEVGRTAAKYYRAETNEKFEKKLDLVKGLIDDCDTADEFLEELDFYLTNKK